MRRDDVGRFCFFCGGNANEPDHAARCDGRQGGIDPPDDPLYGQQGDVPFEVSSATSAAAAATIDEPELARLESVVLDVIAAAPRTCDAVEVATGLRHQTVSARLRGLVLRGRIVASGQARTRSGRRAIVWRIA